MPADPTGDSPRSAKRQRCGSDPPPESPAEGVPSCETESDPETASSNSSTSSVDYQATVFGGWQAARRLSSGNNGQVYVALPWNGDRAVAPVAPVALKVETRALARSHLKTELKVLAKVQGLPGFPRVFDSGQLHRTMWMAMELLGPSLRSLFDKYQFDERLTLLLGDQMLSRLEALHSVGYAHLSVKPDNFCLHVDPDGCVVVHLIDFGRCVAYRTGSGRHISFKDNKGGRFRCWYHSAGALRGKRQSRRDDLQALAHCLVLFTIGDEFMDWREGLPDPAAVDVAEHYRERLPDWLYQFVRLCADLAWAEDPDYVKLHTLLHPPRLPDPESEQPINLCLYAIRRHRQRALELFFSI